MKQTKDIFRELAEQIENANEEAIKKGIKTNAVYLNEDFDYVKELKLLLHDSKIFSTKPMICGKHIFIGKLPENYSFALCETKIENELDYYKNKCEELERKLSSIIELLEN